MINRYGANVSPCTTPATMSKQSVSRSGEQICFFLLSCFHIAVLWLRRFLWVGRRREVFAPSSLESNALESINNSIAVRFLH